MTRPGLPTTFTKNRDCLLNERVMGRFLEMLMGASDVKPLLSEGHFSVDGTLQQLRASHASLKQIDGQNESTVSCAESLGCFDGVGHVLVPLAELWACIDGIKAISMLLGEC